MNALQRLEMLIDEDSFTEFFVDLQSCDPLGFKGKRSYLERIKESQKKTGLSEAVICGTVKLDGKPFVAAVMEFSFMGGSMGSVVGEKVTRAIELATKKKLPMVAVCCSGGARMDEGVLSLMQMAKTSAAIQKHRAEGLFYFTILTDPTMAGVSASYAFLGDLIIAEPGSMIGFAGARVIEQTMKVKLPKTFQSAAFQLEHGQIDKVVERKELRRTLSLLLDFADTKSKKRKAKKAAKASAG
jgi:acetyl-CoA carboxylase carboxyl transferase subunit beta